MSPKVSIIMPSLNVGPYIKKCIHSVMRQTLKDIEIICVDAGSTDGTLEILKEAAAEDERIQIIHSDVKSYGYQMNLGLRAASGKYIGIIETDDYAEPDMFSTLYEIAAPERLDVVKSSFWFYYSKPKKRNIPYKMPSYIVNKKPFCPYTAFANPEEQVEFFNIKPSIWSAIYRRQFLIQNNILFNETPGAAYQDASFNFKVWACAKTVKLTNKAFLHYRQDNEQSSVNSPSKVYCVRDEYDEMERFIEERLAEENEKKKVMLCLMARLKFDTYMWNYARLEKPLNEQFARGVQSDLMSDISKGRVFEEYYVPFKIRLEKMWAEDVEEFIIETESLNERTFFEKVKDKIKRKVQK